MLTGTSSIYHGSSCHNMLVQRAHWRVSARWSTATHYNFSVTGCGDYPSRGATEGNRLFLLALPHHAPATVSADLRAASRHRAVKVWSEFQRQSFDVWRSYHGTSATSSTSTNPAAPGPHQTLQGRASVWSSKSTYLSSPRAPASASLLVLT